MKKTSYLTLDIILAIHEEMVERFGGTHGIRELTLIQSAVARPQSTFGGDDLYPTIFDKAASLFHSLIFNHAFIDANKRTAIVSSARFLSLNGYELNSDQDEFVEFTLKIVKEHLSIEEISNWLQLNSIKSNKS